MTNFLSDTPSVATVYCPGCEPGRDPATEVLDARYCGLHAPSDKGADDPVVAPSSWISGSVEAGGEDNRAWCALFHRAQGGWHVAPASAERSEAAS